MKPKISVLALGGTIARAGWLDGPKARILLTLLIRSGASDETIKDMFSAAALGIKDANNRTN